MGMLCVALVTTAMFTCMTACDNLLANVTGGTQDNSGSKGETKTAKVEFSEAAENFEKQNVKRTDIELKLKSELFISTEKQQNLGLKDSYDIGSTLFLTRVQNEEKHYMSAELKLSDTDTEVSGLIDVIINSADTFAPYLGKNGKEAAAVLVRYLTSIHHYLTGQVDLSAELGMQNGVYNLKARYNDKEAKDKNDVWFVADDTALIAWLNNATKLEVTSNQLNSYMMKTVFSGLTKKYYDKDSANKYVDKKGLSEYNIKVKTDEIITSSLYSGLLDLVGVNDKSTIIGKYSDYFSSIQNWFSLDISDVKATVKNSFPMNVQTCVTLDLNINVKEVRSIIDKLNEDGVIDKASAKTAKSIFTIINGYLCGTNGDADKIGVRLQADLNEDFVTDPAKCKLSGAEYGDYFLGLNAEAEGRMDLRNFVAGIVENVDKYVDDYLKTHGDNYKEELAAIRQKIMDKVEELKEQGFETINSEQMERIIEEVMSEYRTEPTEEETPNNNNNPSSGSGNSVNKDTATEYFNDIIDQFGGGN